MSTNPNNNDNKNAAKVPRQGLDLLLQRKGKTLPPGQKMSFTLIKGPSINRDAIPDPVNPSAAKECFPLIAKFPESVVRPEFKTSQWKDARLYQQDVPKAQIDSDEEAEELAAIENRKRWRRKRNEPPKRQWILQEQVEFLETMIDSKRKKKSDNAKISSRYEGVPEHNPSHFVLLECKTNGPQFDNNNNGHDHNIQVTLLPAPPNAQIAFAQPASRKGMSMNEAELAILDQRNQMTRYMMHNKNQNSFIAQQPVNQSKARLLGRLAKASQKGAFGGTSEAAENDETDDIMGDITFRDRKGNTKARKELLSTLGDGVKVDDDGVLGGAHDDEFGGKRRFGAFKAEETDGKAGQAAQGNSDVGNDGRAMADGFYQRDVKAEYDELDYDIEEQFDDDDVDVGETEVVVESGFAQEEDEEEDGEEEGEGGTEQITGAEGLASVAGFKALLAKAKTGATTDPNQTAEAQAAANGAEAGKKDPRKEDPKGRAALKKSFKAQNEPENHLLKIFKAAEKVKEKSELQEKKPPPKQEDDTGNEVDKDGLRIISLQAVRREIWLNHGRISVKRLSKLFDVNKKATKERQNLFRKIVKELCTMEKDPVAGAMLVLKQHYSNMG
ncbi:expressed unknown protein [Seminavis robusta]|uniref:Transcription initiation factor IIF subunit alpha n=1 Tax=Seminavis robusta TaxID=568900 RepID=A0A9N8HE16_9STRA|nr:expressed unknown protein [Seminavis robusta]|eukprot:Sro452_g145900.1 n/a (613) ;mRNA; f:37744-39768